jgi:polyisoprenyl-phosphate glycosyltransferase
MIHILITEPPYGRYKSRFDVNMRAKAEHSVLLSVVIPVFNEEEGVRELIERTTRSCRGVGSPYELIVVNDGSYDRTLPLLLALSREFHEVRVLDLNRNFGHMAAVTAGLSIAKGDAVAVLDGDLQDPPELIPELVQKWREGADVAYGLRVRRRESLPKRIAIHLFYRILEKVTEVPIPRQAGTFGVIDKNVVEILRAMPERNRFFSGLRAWAGGKQVSVIYEREKRKHGKSRVQLRGMMYLARTAIVSFSKLPLRFVSLFSLACGFILLLVGLGAIIEKLFTNLAIPGWATYTSLIGFVGFVNALVLAIMSEYIAVIYDEVKGRPLYLIRREFRLGRSVRSNCKGFEEQIPHEKAVHHEQLNIAE